MKVRVDFQVLENHDPKTILVGDFSNWAHINNEQSSIQVTLPNGEVVLLPFNKDSINGLNSANLGLGCASDGTLLDLPDGIYEITVLGCPDKFQKTRYYLQNDIAQGKLDKLFTMVDYDCKNVDKEKRDKLLTLNYLMRTAEAATRRGQLNLAEDFFECALEQIDSYLRCDDCF